MSLVRTKLLNYRLFPCGERVTVHAVYTTSVMLMFLAFSSAYGGDMTPAMVPSDKTGGTSVLDGRTFAGEVGPMGKDAMTEDVWVFKEGMFLSKNCEECGFPRSPYSITSEEEGIHFIIETQCPKTDARLVWKGIVKDGRIEGTYTWTRERWYWTIEKKFWFRGQRLKQEDNLQTAAVP